jgi:coatomer subunit delta
MAFGRLENLLSAFPRLLESGQQHTFIEKDSLRYLYQAIEENYVVVLTNRLSNVLSDLRAVSLFASITTSTLRSKGSDRFTEDICFALMLAYDEVYSKLGLAVSNPEILRDVLAMESNEEAILEAIIQVFIYLILCRQRLRKQKKRPSKKSSNWKCQRRKLSDRADLAMNHLQQWKLGPPHLFLQLTSKTKPRLSTVLPRYPPK